MQLLSLSQEDILNSVTYSEVITAIEESFMIYERKEFTMPNRMHIDHGPNTLLLMPCFGKEYFGTKLVSVYPNNTKSKLPVVNGIMVLNDVHKGSPVALLNGITLTALRTGAVGGVGVKHLSSPDASQIGIVGAGMQAYFQIMAASAVRHLKTVYIFDTNLEASKSLAVKVKENLNSVTVYIANSIEDLLEKSEIVITTTTASNPVLPECKPLLEGKHFVGVGSFKPDTREFPKALYELINKIYVDTEYAMEESGDILYPLNQGWISRNQIKTLGNFILTPKEDKNTIRNQTTFFKSVGMALFDLVVSQLVYEKASEKGLGQELVL